MADDRIARWNEKYARGEGLHDFYPSEPLREAIARATPGVALDLACGAGRYALLLAEHGWRVLAVDGSKVAIDLLCAEAERRGSWKLLSRVFAENAASRRLCAKAGFREVGIYRRHAKLDGEWRDCVIVEKLIGEAAR